MFNLKNIMANFCEDESGVTAVEYAIVIAGIASVCLVIFGSTGPVQSMLTTVFTDLEATLKGMVGGTP
ncbi:MAG: Flp family type IVb pilin [Acinetobacter sp.]